MGVNGGVNFCHEANGFGQGYQDFLIVVEVGKGEGTAFAVLEPFLADLIAADGEGPDFRRGPSACRDLR